MSPEDRYDSLFQYYAQCEDLPWQRLKSQAMAESRLDPDAKSSVGALGLAQFMPATWADWTIRKGWAAAGDLLDPRDPEDAIRFQASYMAWLLRETKGDWRLAWAAYNWGFGRVRKAFLTPKIPYDERMVPKETRAYVARIERYLS